MREDLADLRDKAERGEPLTQVEVARLLGLRRQTVHAIERRALSKLKARLGSADERGTPDDMGRPAREQPAVKHPPRPTADRHREQYGVIVLCKDEAEQRALYDRFRAEGLRIRVVVT
jgi:hypothetical protein